MNLPLPTDEPTPAEGAAAPPGTRSSTERGPPAAFAIFRKDGGSLVRSAAEASQLHSKGYYGSFEDHGTLHLDRRETLYLVEVGRLEIRESEDGPPLALPDLVHRIHCVEPGFEVPYLVYRDLRQRGYVVRAGTGDHEFAVLPRGGTFPTTPAQYWVWAISERQEFSLGRLTAFLDRAQGARKKVLLGVVDEESDLTYYLLRGVTPRGRHPAPSNPPPVEGVLLDDRVAIFDPAAVEWLGKRELYGSLVGGRLDLSLVEATHLVGSGQLTVADGRTLRRISRKAFLEHARTIERELDLLLQSYGDLRRAGLVPKTGFKYGTHFRAYEGDPQQTHARYLVHTVPVEYRSSWPEVSRAIRLAHGVKKSFLFSWSDGTETQHYVSLQRIRP